MSDTIKSPKKLIDTILFWKGTLSGEFINITGDSCFPIKPSIKLNPPEGMTKYFLYVDLIRDMGVHLQLSTPGSSQQTSNQPTSTTSTLKKRCFKCGKNVPMSDMRCHVGKHSLRDHVQIILLRPSRIRNGD